MFRQLSYIFSPAQVNVLAYFESLCADAEAANMLINSSLAVLLVHMLRNGRQPALRARQATALGLLLRHATTIVDELYSTSACVSSQYARAGA
jgi:hypothetical protein